MVKRICLLTPGHICSNPRLMKEAIALRRANYEVAVVFVQYLESLLPFDRALREENPDIHFVTITCNNTTARGKRLKWLSGIRQRWYQLGWRLLKINPERAFCRLLPEQVRAARKIPADLYIAHNLAALPVAARVAGGRQSRFAFDAEDFHRGELPAGSETSVLVRVIEEKYFPHCAWVSAASPLIAREYCMLFPGINFPVMHNAFSIQLAPDWQILPETPLRLFWFSQTVGTNRGLQDVFGALQLLPDLQIDLTLLGFCPPELQTAFRQAVRSKQHRLVFIERLSEKELFQLAGTHHIGLALEPGFSRNYQITLTNKIFTYLLAGNALLVSGTPAQSQFIQDNPEVGWEYPIGDVQALAAVLQRCGDNPDLVNQARAAARKTAIQAYHWEKEQAVLLELVKSAG